MFELVVLKLVVDEACIHMSPQSLHIHAEMEELIAFPIWTVMALSSSWKTK